MLQLHVRHLMSNIRIFYWYWFLTNIQTGDLCVRQCCLLLTWHHTLYKTTTQGKNIKIGCKRFWVGYSHCSPLCGSQVCTDSGRASHSYHSGLRGRDTRTWPDYQEEKKINILISNFCFVRSTTDKNISIRWYAFWELPALPLSYMERLKQRAKKLKLLTEEAEESTGQSSSKSRPTVGFATLNAQKKSPVYMMWLSDSFKLL